MNEDYLLIKCFIRKENNQNWLHIKFNPSLPIVGSNYLADFFSEEEMLSRVYKDVEEQIKIWYANNKNTE